MPSGAKRWGRPSRRSAAAVVDWPLCVYNLFTLSRQGTDCEMLACKTTLSNCHWMMLNVEDLITLHSLCDYSAHIYLIPREIWYYECADHEKMLMLMTQGFIDMLFIIFTSLIHFAWWIRHQKVKVPIFKSIKWQKIHVTVCVWFSDSSTIFGNCEYVLLAGWYFNYSAWEPLLLDKCVSDL